MTPGEPSDRIRRHLELEYHFNTYPTDQAVYALALLTGLTTSEVREWFMRERQKDQARLSIPDRKDDSEHKKLREISASSFQDSVESNTRIQGGDVPKSHSFVTHQRILLPSGDKSATDLSRAEAERANSRASEPEASGTTSRKILPATEANHLSVARSKYSSDRAADECEASLPGVVVFPASNSQEPREPLRRKRRYTPEERAKVAETRKRGACEICRAKRMKCLHAPTGSAQTSPLISSASTSSYREPLAVEAPTTTGDQTRVSESEPVPIGRVNQPEANGAHSIEAPNRSETQSNFDRILPEEWNGNEISAQDESFTSCTYCNFTPVGDPKWYRSNLARHMKVAHNAEIQKFYCSYEACDKAYSRSDNLRQHIRCTHEQRQPDIPSGESTHREPALPYLPPAKDAITPSAHPVAQVEMRDPAGPTGAASSPGAGQSNGLGSPDSSHGSVQGGADGHRSSSTATATAKTQDERLAIQALLMAVNDAQTTEVPSRSS